MIRKAFFVLACSLLLANQLSFSQASTDQNFVIKNEVKASGQKTVAAVDNLGVEGKSQTVGYLDGLGRPVQSIIVQSSPLGKDIVSPQEYDGYGREAKKFLPYVDNGSNFGSLKPSMYADQSNFYSPTNSQTVNIPKDKRPFSQSYFEASPLSRVLEQGAPGETWQPGAGHTVTGISSLNTALEGVIKWNIDNTTGECLNAGNYSDGDLYKMVTGDENGNKTIEYKDKEGKTILKKVQIGTSPGIDHSGWLCTYYVYDDFKQLRVVIQPKAVEQILLGTPISSLLYELCFRYEYDERHRMIVKKIPGAGEVYMVYDKRDRLVYTQDANMRLKSQWMTTIYDELNRPVMTGITGFVGSRVDLQTIVNQLTGTGNRTTISSGSPVLANLTIATQTASQDYVASQQISFVEGFSSVSGADFTAKIDGTFSSESVGIADNPIPSSSNFTALTITYYDDYSSIGGAYNTQNNGQLDAGTNLYPEALPSQAAKITRGLTVGTKVRVLENPSDLSSSPMLSTISFYDEKGRNIQTQSDNYKGGKDVVTTLYDFSGKTLATYQSHNNPASQLVFDGVKTNNEYDNAGRLLRVYKTIHNDVAGKRLLVTNEYDELGKLKKKNLAPNYHGTGLESLEYEYNIRGWMLGMNRGYARDDNNSHYFGFDLGYDKANNNLIGNQTYMSPQFNGNIAGTVWKSKGDGEKRKYDFTYDAANRLLSADFNQYSSGVFDKSAGFDFSTKELSYDANGNILTMKQWGLKLNTSVVIDRLQYQYANNSNKLLNVTDLGYLDQVGLAVQPFDNKLGDFTDKHISTSTGALDCDYDYDGNGNLTRDWNKGIISYGYLDQPDHPMPGISYNHLNLPYQVSFGGVSPYDPNQTKGTIQYIYDALGTKLQKIVHESPSTTNGNKTIVTTTDYIGIFQYQNNQLQFFSNEEGRFRPTGGTVTTMCEASVQVACQINMDGSLTCPSGTQNPLNSGCQGTQISYAVATDYLIKDHLGNVRSMLTDEDKVNAYPPASMESANATTEKLFYSKIDETHAPLPSGYPTTDHYTDPNQYAAKVSGSGNKVGPGITLKVMAGDKFNLRVTSWYSTNNAAIQSTVGTPVSDIVGALVSGISGLSKMTAGDLQSVGSIPTGIGSFLSGKQTDPGATKPKAYVNWILFDEQFKYVAQSSGADPVPTEDDFGLLSDPDPNHKHVHLHLLQDKTIAKNGYLYVYVSNETPNIDVYFDNLQVTHYSGPLIAENHYYPFGLDIAALTETAAGILENKRKFNSGNELQDHEFLDGTGLEIYGAFFRDLDPQLGRWWQIDPKPSENESPYSSMSNNPIGKNDVFGDTPEDPDPFPRHPINSLGDAPYLLYNAIGGGLNGLNNLINKGKDYIKALGNDGIQGTLNTVNTDFGDLRNAGQGVIDYYKETSISQQWTDFKTDMSNPDNWARNLENAAVLFATGKLASESFSLRGAVNVGKSENVSKGLSLIGENKKVGDAFRNELGDLLKKSGLHVEYEVPKSTPFGTRVIDIEVSKGKKVLGGLETKTGGSRYKSSQRIKDLYLWKVRNYPVNLVRKPKNW